MANNYSQTFKTRVVAYTTKHTTSQAAKKFNVSVQTVNNWIRAEGTTGHPGVHTPTIMPNQTPTTGTIMTDDDIVTLQAENAFLWNQVIKYKTRSLRT